MKRRSLLLASGAAGVAAATGAGYRRWQEIPSTMSYPGRSVGHALRDGAPFRGSAPTAEITTDVAIVGSGIAGLTAAWRLAREGHRRFVLVTGPEPHGNAASGRATVAGEPLRFPTGAHYLPLPSRESTHVRAMLADAGVLVGDAASLTPTYDERVLVHAPDERLFRDGRWQEGLVPADDDAAPRRPREGSAIDRFFRAVDAWRDARGTDGRRAFTVPVALASNDARFAALDDVTFAAWLDAEGHVDPALRWYLDYCCRDDYGADATRVSAWAGLHYFAARDGRAANAERGAVLTWPEGLDAMADFLDRSVPWSADAPRRLVATALAVRDTRAGVDVDCVAADGTTLRVRARRAISAMPLVVAKHVVAPLASDGHDPRASAPSIAPWMVANVIVARRPEEEDGAPPAWDNVIFGSDGLGWVDATHQAIRVAPSAATVFTTYRAFGDRDPDAARRWMDRAPASELASLAIAELKEVYGWRLAPCVTRVDVTLRGHAMATPVPGTRANAGLRALREADGPIVYAHSDLSGYSVFEEAAWWGWRAAERVAG